MLYPPPIAQRVARTCVPLALIVLPILALGQSAVDAKDLPETPPGLTYDMANAVRLKEPTVLSAIETRKHSADQLVAIKYRLTDAVGSFKDHTLMTMRPTRHGLQYFQHAAVPHGFGKLHEAGVSLYGLASVVYWVSFLPEPPAPWQVAVEQGRVFSADDAFVIRQVDPTGEVTRTRCEPGRRQPASAINAALRGDAVEFSCIDTVEGDDPVRRDIVYLERYGQYIPSVNYEKGGGVATKFQVVAVTVR